MLVIRPTSAQFQEVKFLKLDFLFLRFTIFVHVGMSTKEPAIPKAFVGLIDQQTKR